MLKSIRIERDIGLSISGSKKLVTGLFIFLLPRNESPIPMGLT